MEKHKKIFVAGHSGMVGSSILRKLDGISDNIITKSHADLDLTKQEEVFDFFNEKKPEQVYIAAGMVGGIYANSTYPADFIYNNIMIQTNIINSAFMSGVKRLLFLASSSAYPKLSEQPIKEESLLTGPLELTNEAYAIAKISGIKLCESYNKQYGKSHKLRYQSLMPTNLYGPGDNYHPQNSHVVPALIKRVHDAKSTNEPLSIWGSGKARREFLFVDDLAEACIFIMSLKDKAFEELPSHLNVGFGQDISIRELVESICEVLEFKGEVIFDKSMPEGVQRKALDTSRLNKLGWSSSTDIKEGLKKTYSEYLDTLNN
jgi:GDP-L-fucose synthase